MGFQGVEFSPEMRQLIVNVKQFFDKNRNNPQVLQTGARTLTASALGISETTVKNVMATFNSQGSDGLFKSRTGRRGRPSFAIQPGVETLVRKLIREENSNGRQVTIDLIAKHLTSSQEDHKIAPTTLWRALTRWGFEFGEGVRSAKLKESDRIIIQRRQYLRQKIANRKEDGNTIRPEVYLDESYVNKNHSRDATWYFSGDGSIVSKPTGKGERLIIVNAIDKNGWIPNVKLVFQAAKKTDDYHSNMNWSIFREWFENKLVKNIPDNSLIIMDNAAYHNVLAEEAFPKPGHTVRRLQEWLTHNDIPWGTDMVKAELHELCRRFAPKPEFALDRIASKYGHSILRTPPYHPELQPIETCWAVVKGYVAAHNDFTMERVRALLEEGFRKVNSHTINGIIKKVIKEENAFWTEDAVHFWENDRLKAAEMGGEEVCEK